MSKAKLPLEAAEQVKNVADYSAIGVAGAAFMEWVSPIAAVFSIVWLSVRLWEKVTGRKFAESYIARVIRCVECPLADGWAWCRRLLARMWRGGAE